MAVYNLIIKLTRTLLPILGGMSKKLKKGIDGRKNTFKILQENIHKDDQAFWFHCASLGEYEQGLPVFELLKSKYPKSKIVLSFFSPSGYEIRKQNPITSIVVYLPLDTRKQVQRFLALTHPKLVVFVKYEFWPNYLKALKNHNAKVILISALLRPDQHFFKFYGKQWQKLFFSFDHIFTQNIESKELLQGIGYTNATVAKDNRFDRVSNQLKENNSLSFINEFVDEKFCVVAGSTWKEDEDILVPYVQNADQKMKFIIVPHSIEEQGIRRLKKYFGGKAVLYSEYKHEELSEKQVFIVDTVGLLSKIYNYADIAYVGGGMGSSGLHNILEPAVFAVPIIIGKNFRKFPEAKELISLGGLISIDSAASFSSALDTFIEDIELRKKSGEKNKAYIEKNTGASSAILKAIGLLLKD